MLDRLTRISGSWRQFTLTVLLVALAFIVFADHAQAADFRSGTDITVDPTEQVDDTLYAVGQTIVMAGHVTGQIVTAGETVTISGQVDGDVNAVASTGTISGVMGGAVRVAGGTITISGQVKGDLLIVSGTVTIAPTAIISGDVVITSGTVNVNGPVAGKVRGNANDLYINATVGGNVDVVVDKIALGPAARLAGGLRYTSPDPVVATSGAVITGAPQHDIASDRNFPGRDYRAWLHWLVSPEFRLLSILVSGVVLVAILPTIAVAGADGIRRSPIVALLAGVLTAIFAPVALILLGATLVGLPAALLGFVGYFVVLYLSQVIAGLAIGRWILPKSWDVDGRGYNLLAMAIGVALIGAVRFIPLSYVNRIVSLVVDVLAFGGVVSAARYARRRRLA